jgi:hypothetical protein
MAPVAQRETLPPDDHRARQPELKQSRSHDRVVQHLRSRWNAIARAYEPVACRSRAGGSAGAIEPDGADHVVVRYAEAGTPGEPT